MTPHVCPVCRGNGLVPNGFYLQTTGQWTGTGTGPERCRTCNGQGMVWEKVPPVTYEYYEVPKTTAPPLIEWPDIDGTSSVVVRWLK